MSTAASGDDLSLSLQSLCMRAPEQTVAITCALFVPTTIGGDAMTRLLRERMREVFLLVALTCVFTKKQASCSKALLRPACMFF